GTLGLSVGFLPYTNTSFQITDSGREIFRRGSIRDTLNFQTINVGQGGLNRIEMGLGWRINQNIAIGYAASLMYASIDDQYTTAFDQRDYQAVNTTFQTSGSGFGNRFGAQLTLPSIGGGNNRLNLGMAVDLPTTIEAEKVQETTFVTQDPEDEDDTEAEIGSGEIRTPLGITAGLTFEPSQRIAFTAEGRFQQWSEYKNEVSITPQNIEFTDRLKVGAGIKYYPYVTGSDKFLSRFKYRLGATYDSGHLTINDEDISSLRFSAGLGILSPTRISGFNSSVDISFYYEIRGTKSQNLVKENIWGAKLSLNLAEIFFYRPKLQ
ncbi:MAG: hypothetical protein JXR26_09740, partial [Balneolaceae bacterium]|nr:hypothetical protein [Balneolaceae bacterium]